MIRIPILAAAMLLGAECALPQEQAPSAVVIQTNVSSLAATAMEQAALARRAALAGDRETAGRHIDQALAAARNAETAGRQAGLESGGRVLVPIEAEVEVEATHKPRRAGAGVTSRVEDVSGRVTRTSVDVAAVRQRLEAARGALDRGDLTAAAGSLAAVEQSVQSASARGEMPLARARQNLEMARRWAAEGKPKSAKAPLQEAARALREYERRAPEPQASQAAALLAEVEAYARRVSRERDAAPARIAGFLDRTANWPLMMGD